MIASKKEQDLLYYPKCSKTQELKQKIKDFQTAIVFLKLRQEGCKKREAITFCSKDVCKIDVSKHKDGPANCRKLKPLNVKGLQVNGWELTGKRDYDLGSRFRILSQLGIHSDEEDQKITKIIESKIQNNSSDYLYRIRVLENYMQKIESKCHIPQKNRQLMQNKINTIQNEMVELQTKPMYHLKYKDLNLYEIFQDYPQTKELQDQYNSNYINLFDSFQHLYNKSDLQGQIELSKIEMKPPPKITPIIIPELKKSLSYSSKNSFEIGSKVLQMGEENEDNNQMLINEQLSNSSQASPTSSLAGSQKLVKINTTQTHQQLKSKFNTTFNQSQERKDTTITPNSTNYKSSPKFKFIDLKYTPKNSQTFSEHDSLINEISLNDCFSLSNSEQQSRKCQDMNPIPIINQMEFPQKIEWLLNSAIIDRSTSPLNPVSSSSKLNQQVQKVQQFKDKLMKRSMNNFYDPTCQNGFKTYQDFFKCQKKVAEQTQQSFYKKTNSSNTSKKLKSSS